MPRARARGPHRPRRRRGWRCLSCRPTVRTHQRRRHRSTGRHRAQCGIRRRPRPRHVMPGRPGPIHTRRPIQPGRQQPTRRRTAKPYPPARPSHGRLHPAPMRRRRGKRPTLSTPHQGGRHRHRPYWMSSPHPDPPGRPMPNRRRHPIARHRLRQPPTARRQPRHQAPARPHRQFHRIRPDAPPGRPRSGRSRRSSSRRHNRDRQPARQQRPWTWHRRCRAVTRRRLPIDRSLRSPPRVCPDPGRIHRLRKPATHHRRYRPMRRCAQARQ